MEQLINIQFLKGGTWGDHPSDPLFDVVIDEVRGVSAALARTAVDAGKARFVDSDEEEDIAAKNAENARIETIQAKIQTFNLRVILSDELNSGPLSSGPLKGILEYIEGTEIDESFEEFVSDAQKMKGDSIETLNKRIERALQAEADAAELEAFRKKKAAGPVKKAEADAAELEAFRKKKAAGPVKKAEGKSVKKKAEGK